jgi:phage terminase large subunit-like protein
MSATTESDPFDNRWFEKRKATNRIDAAVALCMAVGAATQTVVVDSGALERAILARGGFA